MLSGCCRAKAARKAREAGQSEKRRKMREDLEKREGAWHSARNEEQRAKNKLRVSTAYCTTWTPCNHDLPEVLAASAMSCAAVCPSLYMSQCSFGCADNMFEPC